MTTGHRPRFAVQALALAALLVSLAVTSRSEAQPQFEADAEGYVVMEMESVPIPGGHEWSRRTALPEASGGAYYRFTGNSICNGPAGSPLRYTFRIDTAGTYELRLRAARIYHCVLGAPHDAMNRCSEEDRTCDSLGEPVDNTCGSADQCIRTDISNDAFVHVETDTGEYVEFNGQPGSSVGDPIKLFGGANNAWGFTGRRALDIAGKHDAQWTLPAGDYTLVVQGRSQGFRIDRMVFFDIDRGSVGDAEGRAETLYTAPPMEDAGAADAGSGSGVDAGAGTDAGPGTDTDAGAGTDAGTAREDAGMAGDASPAIDGGAGIDGGAEGTSEGGCSASPSRRTPLVAWMLLAVACVGVSRRR